MTAAGYERTDTGAGTLESVVRARGEGLISFSKDSSRKPSSADRRAIGALAPESLRLLNRELEETAQSIRRGTAPRTALHALLLRDDQTLGEISALTHKDPRDHALVLDALVDLSLVFIDQSEWLARYSLGSGFIDTPR